MLNLAVVVLTATYPLLVYLGLAHLKPGVFGLLLAGLILLRLSRLDAKLRQRLILVVVLLTTYALIIAVSNSETMLRFYPVIVNLMMLAVFSHSLSTDQPILERLARWRGMQVSPFGVPYLRTLTIIWCAFFAANVLIAAYTAMSTSMATWALYNGLIVYVAMGCLLLGEYVFRGYYKKRVGISE